MRENRRMQNNINYQMELDDLIDGLEKEGRVPTLLLHSCCAPCSSYCLSYLSNYFYITVFYYNPNIYPEEEYFKRVKEQERFISAFPTKYPVKFIAGEYNPKDFYDVAKGLEHEREGGERCTECFRLRLIHAAEKAKELESDYFTTTLSISPMKDAARLNRLGDEIASEYGLKYLHSDFKKKNGFLKSTQISKEYGMYRQDYCGCIFSLKEREDAKAKKMANL